MKYIYLDQNKWIELLKGLNDGNSEYIKLFNIMMENVHEHEWAFPISLIHVKETMKRKDEKSRKNLLNLMFVISGGCSISDYSTANILEFNMWVQKQNVDCNKLKNSIIRHDWTNLIGLSTNNAEVTIGAEKDSETIRIIKSIINQHSCDRMFFDLLCNQCKFDLDDEKFYYECLIEGRNSFRKWKEDLKKTADYKEKHLYPAYLIHVFFTEYKNLLTELPYELQENVKKIFEKNSKNKTMAISNLETLPGFNIHNRLVFELYSNPDKEVHPHDFNDLAYMRVAVPYCDVVVGENYWCDRVKHYKLDTKYNTFVSTKLFDIMEV